MTKDRRRIFHVVCGDIIGVIDEPLAFDEKRPPEEQLMVRVGSRSRSRRDRPIQSDMEQVLKALREFLEQHREHSHMRSAA